MGRRRKVQVNEVRDEVLNMMRSATPSERERHIVKLWQQWETAKAYLTKVRSEGRQDVELCRTNLKERMELGLDANDEEAPKRKLVSVEIAWQDLEEAKAKMKDAVGGATDAVKSLFERLKEAVIATNQLELPGTDGSAVKAGSHDDDDGEASDIEEDDEADEE